MAVALLVVAALVVLLAVVLGRASSAAVTVLTLAGALAVLLGAAATRIVASELAQSRRDAARDRAEQAQAYTRLTEVRVAENAEYVAGVESRLEGQRTSLARLEDQLAVASLEAAEARRSLVVEQARVDQVESEKSGLARLLDLAEERAAEAIVRLAELEQEHDVLIAERDGARDAERLRVAAAAEQGLHRRRA